MKILAVITMLLFALALPGSPALAQAPPRLDSSLVSFFVGEWQGEGAFPNGYKVKATVDFHLTLDSAWLVNEHRDLPPGPYKGTSYWGVDEGTGQFVGYTFDNFHGYREWASAGWKRERIVLTSHSQSQRSGTNFEHFIYQRLSDSQFRMTYETSRDCIQWYKGDSVLFTRVRP